jgi:hypothetical protein
MKTSGQAGMGIVGIRTRLYNAEVQRLRSEVVCSCEIASLAGGFRYGNQNSLQCPLRAPAQQQPVPAERSLIVAVDASPRADATFLAATHDKLLDTLLNQLCHLPSCTTPIVARSNLSGRYQHHLDRPSLHTTRNLLLPSYHYHILPIFPIYFHSGRRTIHIHHSSLLQQRTSLRSSSLQPILVTHRIFTHDTQLTTPYISFSRSSNVQCLAEHRCLCQ